MTNGYVHSIESMGLVDGPGIRTVVFLQGCSLRCLYCHNPDTWDISSDKAKIMTPDELIGRLVRFKSYYGTDGGVTFSGGEPLMQPDFLAEALSLARMNGIGTALDTAGVGLGFYDDILENTDLLLLDIKHYDPQKYREITGKSITEFEKFLEDAQRYGVRIWIRHVVVPSLNDSDGHFIGLERYLKEIKNIEKVELLPYHTLGVHKYRGMGLNYRLKDIPPMNKDILLKWEERLNSRDL